jgi:hypothetical protein
MLTAKEYASALEPKRLNDEELDNMLSESAAAALKERRREFHVEIPRHSIDRAADLARDGGWWTEISAIRSPGPDAMDLLCCRLPTTARGSA